MFVLLAKKPALPSGLENSWTPWYDKRADGAGFLFGWKRVIRMTLYEKLSLVIAFATLIATILKS